MLAIYWEPKSAFQNTFCRHSTRSKHNNTYYSETLRTLKSPAFLSAGHSTWGVTGAEARKNAGICLVFVRILPVFVRNPVPELYWTSPGAPDWTENTFYHIFIPPSTVAVSLQIWGGQNSRAFISSIVRHWNLHILSHVQWLVPPHSLSILCKYVDMMNRLANFSKQEVENCAAAEFEPRVSRLQDRHANHDTTTAYTSPHMGS